MRAFIAVNLPPSVRTALHDALEPLRARGLAVRWTAPESLHVTLKFLGEIEGSERDRIEGALDGIVSRHAPLELRLGGVGAFPSLRRAQTLWCGADGGRALSRLQGDVELECARLGYARETRPFRAHVTVARTRRGEVVDIERFAASVTYTATIEVESIELMRSHTGPAGARYEVLRRFGLQAVPR